MPGDNSQPLFSDALTETPDGIIITVEVSAGSRQERFPDGYNPWRKAFGIAVTAPPVQGKANKAISTVIAAYFSIRPSEAQIISGQTSSVKRVLLTGLSRSEVCEQLSKAITS